MGLAKDLPAIVSQRCVLAVGHLHSHFKIGLKLPDLKTLFLSTFVTIIKIHSILDGFSSRAKIIPYSITKSGN
jgi:hypothetical protein